MTNHLFELIFQVDDFRLYHSAQTLARNGHLVKARRKLLQILCNREERFGSNSPESLTALLWLADLYNQCSLRNLYSFSFQALLFQSGSITEEQSAISTQLQKQCLMQMTQAAGEISKALQSNLHCLNYAERLLETNLVFSTLYLRIEMALALVLVCLNRSLPALPHFDKALNMAETSVVQATELVNELDLEALVELAKIFYSHEQHSYKRAVGVLEMYQWYSMQRDDFVAQMSLYHRLQ